ncbi:MAG: 2-oxoacid:acceptor oxidoreductase family protein [Dehalococcoidia bacterium]
MATQDAPRHDVIMTGVGGKGVLTAGLLLAQAGMARYRNVLWFPSYQAAMRGGPSECTVILSDEDIASPILTQAQALVVMDPSQLQAFEGRVKPGGILITESAGLKEAISRKDVQTFTIPAVEAALGLGEIQTSNLFLLGAYLALTGAIPPELGEGELEKRFSSREKALRLNKQALRQGMSLVAK